MKKRRTAILSGIALAVLFSMAPSFAAPAPVPVARKVVVVPTPRFGWYWGYDPFYPYATYLPVRPVPENSFPVEFHVHPWKADLILDGKNLGEVRQFGSAGYPLWLKPGEHHVELSYPGFQTVRTTIETAPMMDQDFSFSLKGSERSQAG